MRRTADLPDPQDASETVIVSGLKQKEKTMNLFKTVLLASALTLSANVCSAENAAAAATLTKGEIEKIVHDYLLENPQILMEMNVRLQQLMADNEISMDKEYIKAHYDYLFNNPNDATIGPKDAKNVIIEFSDYNCGYCKRSKQLFFKILSEHAQANDIRYIFKEYPILGEGSTIAAKASLAVYQLYPKQFLDYHMAVINGKRIESIDDIKAATDSLKMDWNKIKAVMESKEIWETIKLNLKEGKAMNVTGTPCYIINDEFIRGAPTSTDFIKDKLN
jgi:protein-disulfide isomerase